MGEYWTVDPKIEAVKVYRALGGRLAKGAELSLESNDVLVSSLLPEFTLPLAEVFRLPHAGR